MNQKQLFNAVTLITGTLVLGWSSIRVEAALPAPDSRSSQTPGSHQLSVVDQLSQVKNKISRLEQALLNIPKGDDPKIRRAQLKKIQTILKLQKAEQNLGEKRLKEIENSISEFEQKKLDLKQKISTHQQTIRLAIQAIEYSRMSETDQSLQSLELFEDEKILGPRRLVLSRLADRSLKQIEALKAELGESNRLEQRIQDDKQQVAYLLQDLKEQEGLLQFNQQLQLDFLKKRGSERMAQFNSYKKLKNAEAEVESLIGQFNARQEIENTTQTPKEHTVEGSETVRLKSKLEPPLPNGKVVSQFGRVMDSQSGLYIFKKGIEIAGGKQEKVRAISTGRVAYSGELPHYGSVVIIDHGEHFYSICAHLGSITKKTKEWVAAGDPIGLTADSGDPLYFELRSRNVAVNPLQWLYN